MKRFITTVALVVGLIAAIGGPAVAVGTSSPARAKPGTTAVSLTAKPAIVTWGQTTTFTGKVTGSGAATTVEIQRDPYPFGDGFAMQRSIATAKNGSFSVALLATVNTQYRAVATGPNAATSPTVLVRVRPKVGLSLSTATPTAGSTVRFFGSVKPPHDASPVSIQKRTATGSWTTVARAVLRAAGTTRSAYSKLVTIRRAGTYRVKIAAHGDHLSGVSRERTITPR
ncbi:MAG: peptidase and in kexin sedolisin [Solirubrobacterales bacterium]|nr:peptidase and in kexin sedolisin [Solirubrobacterales bacterium]